MDFIIKTNNKGELYNLEIFRDEPGVAEGLYKLELMNFRTYHNIKHEFQSAYICVIVARDGRTIIFCKDASIDFSTINSLIQSCILKSVVASEENIPIPENFFKLNL